MTERAIEPPEHRAVMATALHKSLEIFTCHDEEAFEDVMASGLQTLASAMDVHRIVVYRLVEIDGASHLKQTYRWTAAKGRGTDASFHVLPNNQTVTNWLEIAKQDACVNLHLSNMSENEVTFISTVCIVP